jgi:dipeptidyl-peptidase-4
VRNLEQYYRDAETLSQATHRRLIRNCEIYPHWIGARDEFWYTRETPDGREWTLVDAQQRSRRAAFDHGRLATALSKAVGKSVDPKDLPLDQVVVDAGARTVSFLSFGCGWTYNTDTNSLARGSTSSRPDLLWSPDKGRAVFRRGNDIWLKEMSGDQDRALTTDGEPHYRYGAPPECLESMNPGRPPIPAPPEALWSPDGSRLLTVQTDDRSVRLLPVIEWIPADGLRPKVHETRVAWPGDTHVPEFRLVCIDTTSGRQVAARWPRIPAVRMNATPFGANVVWWSSDNRHCWFVDTQRGEKAVRLVEFDTETGECRQLFEERSETYIDIGYNVYTACQSEILADAGELLWWSERSGWGHLYLIDLKTGATKRAITSGEWLVRDVLFVDAQRREVWVIAMGRDPARHAYFREILRVPLDGGSPTVLASGDVDHLVWRRNEFNLMAVRMLGEDPGAISGVSPSGGYFVDIETRPDCASLSTLRDRDGNGVMQLERAELDGLPESFRWPEIIRTKAADGTTDIYGVMVRPPEADAGRALPVINLIYGGPQVDAAPHAGFGGFVSRHNLLELCTYAQLGFVAVMVDGRGTTGRSKAFHDESYGRVQTASNIDDHICAIRQLAAQHPFIDLERVGITGFSGGGMATAHAMLSRPEFYKVGIAGAGNYDQRLFWASWGERYQGLVNGNNYDSQALDLLAPALAGKILFVHGLLDLGCHPSALLRLTDALEKADKDYDLLLQSNAAHRVTSYTTRRAWDYFTRHLAGVAPPKGLKLTVGADLMYEKFMRKAAETAAFVAGETAS